MLAYLNFTFYEVFPTVDGEGSKTQWEIGFISQIKSLEVKDWSININTLARKEIFYI